MLDIDPLVNEASSTVHIINGSCQPHSLSIEQHIKLFLVKQLVEEYNRMFTNILAIFSMLSGIDIYDTMERPYFDDEIIIAIHNLHILILKLKNI